MSDQAQFTEEQWQLLVDTPALIGAAVMVCSRSGAVGTVKEAYTLTRGLLDAPRAFEQNRLVQAVVEHRTTGAARGNDWQERYRGSDPAELEREMLQRCEEVAQLIEAVGADRETEDFKRWLHAIGNRVAESSAEGGFLGFGGERVSAEEDRLLGQIEQALKLR